MNQPNFKTQLLDFEQKNSSQMTYQVPHDVKMRKLPVINSEIPVQSFILLLFNILKNIPAFQRGHSKLSSFFRQLRFEEKEKDFQSQNEKQKSER